MDKERLERVEARAHAIEILLMSLIRSLPSEAKQRAAMEFAQDADQAKSAMLPQAIPESMRRQIEGNLERLANELKGLQS